MEQANLLEMEKELMYYRKKVVLLEDIIKKSNDQKMRMAKLISKLIGEGNSC